MRDSLPYQKEILATWVLCSDTSRISEESSGILESVEEKGKWDAWMEELSWALGLAE